MAEELANHRQTLSQGECPRRKRVAKIVDTDILQTSPRAQDLPGVLEVPEGRACIPPGDDPRIAGNPGQIRNHGAGGPRKGYPPCTGLGVRWMEYRSKPPDYMKKKTKYLFV